MGRHTLKFKDIPQVGAKSTAHLALIVFFAVLGAGVLGAYGPSIPPSLSHLLVQWFTHPNPGQARSEPSVPPIATVIPFGFLGLLLGSYLAVGLIGGMERIGNRWDRMEPIDKITYFVGVLFGLIVAVPFLFMLQNLFQNVDLPIFYRVGMIAVVTIGLGALGVYTTQTISALIPIGKNRVSKRRSGIKILDTNVIIDGRIYDVLRTGFLDGQLYVPGFVLDELQYIADSHDGLRRQRGRRGLEVLRHMQGDFELEVRSQDRLAPDQGDGVDARLVRLAKALGADIVTNDFNLRRVAELQEVRVLSLNDLSLALRSNILPQETLELAIIREGNQIGQGIGYLEDGTMVVIENGKGRIGETVEVVVTQVHQTERGKMIFGEISGNEEVRYERRRPARPRTSA
jgi:uncharacterized protein YacL